MANNLKIKDLVIIGIFSVIYIIILFTVGMVGMIPLLYLYYMAVVALVAGVVIMLFMAKIPKKWGLFILGMIPAIVLLFMGHTYILLIHAVIFNFIAELLFRKGEFKSFKHHALAYAFFSCAGLGGPMQMLLVRDKYLAILAHAASEEYLLNLEKVITYPNMAIVYIVTFISGLIGAYIGKAMLKKHFEKAGII